MAIKTKKLSPAGKAVVFIAGAALIIGGGYKFGAFDFLKNKADIDKLQSTVATTAEAVPTKSSDADMTISLDEWVGWSPILIANGGLSTQSGSIFDQLGLNLKINVINDGNISSTSLIGNKIDGAGYTVNRYSYLWNKFKTGNTEVVMPFIVNKSTGGDGIVAKNGISSVRDLVGKKIGIPRFSEGQTLAWWLMTKQLTPDQIKKIEVKMVYFDTPDDAAKALFAGNVDAAATWQPFINDAKSNGCSAIFTTKSASNLVLDGVVFRKDYLTNHRDDILKFMEGTLKAQAEYASNYNPIRNSFPYFSSYDDGTMKTTITDATMADYTANDELLNGTAQMLFGDMSNIWNGIGETAFPQDANKAFDRSLIADLSNKFQKVQDTVPAFTQEQRQEAVAQSTNDSLIKKSVTVEFKVGSSEFTNPANAYKVLNDFVNMAKLADNTIIQIEGNTSSEGNPVVNQKLSAQRAEAIRKYFMYQGIDNSRMIAMGNGSSKPVGDNATAEGRIANRRTDIFFKVVQ